MQLKVNINHILISFIIILASLRGVFVYHLGLSPSIAYPFAAFLLICFGVLSLLYLLGSNPRTQLVLFWNAVKLNAFFGVYFSIAQILVNQKLDLGTLYSFFVFPSIFLLLKLESKWLNGIVYAITSVTVLGVLLFLKIGIDGGFDAIEVAILTLRPGDLEYSRIGENLLPAGYQGHHHDAANILVMCTILLLTKCIHSKSILSKYIYFLFYGLAFLTTLLTGSGANIVILVFVSILIFLILASSRTSLLLIYITIGALISKLAIDYLSDYLYFLDHILQDQGELEGGGIFNSLNFDSVLSSVHAILFGFNFAFQVPLRFTEIAFLKILISYGIVPFLLQLFILFSPIYYFFVHKKNKNNMFEQGYLRGSKDNHKPHLIILAMPALAGTLTLLHYGSLLRVTSIGLYCVILTIYFKEYLKAQNLILKS